jgi:hypothetical protein
MWATFREQATPSRESLREIGFPTLKILGDDEVKASNLAQFDAVVLGSAPTTSMPTASVPGIPSCSPMRSREVSLSCNTTRRQGRNLTNCRTPFVFRTDRVTDENAEVRILAPDHPVLNFPNKITASDFGVGFRSAAFIFRSVGYRLGNRFSRAMDPNEKPSTPACS